MQPFLFKRRLFSADRAFALVVRTLAVLVVVLFILLVGYLVFLSWPSIERFGIRFLWSSDWAPAKEQFGALPAVVGTLITAILSMVIAIPISVGIALMITQIMKPSPLTTILSRLIELLAAIPSIIYGMWGLFFLAPFLQSHFQPWMIALTRDIPLLNKLFAGLPIGIGVFTAGLVLAIMVTPLISSMMRDVLAEVPKDLIEAAYAIGATRFEVIKRILFPYVRAGLLGSVVLGFGRALGETMAVTFVIGNSHRLFQGLFMPGTTISAVIANEFTEATGKIYPAALTELGLILFAITFIILSISRYFLHHAKPRGGSQ
ncbi:MAG: phosphate ABC transporter permease subunit PstC [Gammaproteobacteria bacterium]|nr:phosphate ABC transporter permease subunit PstC [Gammaproteobacteria bacterium]